MYSAKIGNKGKIQIFKEAGGSRYIFQNKLDKACFQHNMVHGDFKDLPGRTASGKVLCDKAFSIAKNPNYDGYQLGLASKVYKFLIKSILLVLLLMHSWQRVLNLFLFSEGSPPLYCLPSLFQIFPNYPNVLLCCFT